MSAALLESEQQAYDLVSRIGINRAERVLTQLTNRIQRRIYRANQEVIGAFFDDGCIRKSPWEIELNYQLKLGLTLMNTDGPSQAKARIFRRIEERKARLAARKSLYT
ncbi:hypothetical protein [Alteromonas oceanisediminis]|uniref:hypothetical protein n=1 Tax=Alteromonas oceanisediminis TaxID=2836180 RepID=UPI001BDADC09|nr:hypothetical protein [Alteromonas oceanisediminis]MBT0587935.1 hypothetical protein [Alteromonas oceanisediminis]